MADEAIVNLKRCVKEYRDLDNELRELNKKIYDKREDRRILHVEMSDIINLPQFSGVDKLKIDDDGSTIKIARPGTHTKPWSLSKKELETLLVDYFRHSTNPHAQGCLQYILEERRKALVSKDFDFTRVIPEE